MTNEQFQRVKSIFIAAVEVGEDQRPEVLDRECSGDAEVRHEVEALLAARRSEQLRTGAACEMAGHDGPKSETLWHSADERIGSYRLLENLGTGTFGEVWLAEQENPVRPKVAIKILKPGMDTREVLARFETERRSLAMMNHPNVARVSDAGATPQGRPYFVMEYVPGLPITKYCDAARLPIRPRLELFLDICRAVEHAHQKGIIHRDLKPQNILVTVSDGKPVPKVIDFGVAKALAGDDKEVGIATEFGRGVGTLEYMPPEQTGRIDSDVDIRADVYSLGVVLYEMLTGTLPLDFQGLRRASLDSLTTIICESDPPTPSARLSTLGSPGDGPESAALAAARGSDPRSLRSLLLGDLDWIVMKAMEKDRLRRYGSVAELAADVERHLAGEPVKAAPPSNMYRLRKFVRRHRATAVAGSITAIFLVGTTGVSAYFAHRERIQANVALNAQGREATQRRAAEAARDRLLAIQDFLIRTLRSQDPNSRDGHTDILVSEAMQQAIVLIDRGDLAAEPRIVADILNAVSVVLLNLGKPGDAERASQRALRLYDAESPVDQLAKAECLGNLGLCLCASGQLEDGFRELNRALEIRRQVQGTDDLKAVKLLNGLGLALENLGRPVESLPYHESALKVCSSLITGDHADLASCINNVAGCLSRLGRHADALPQYENALAMCRRLHKGDHPDVATGMNNLAFCLDALGRRSEAEAIYRESLDMRERLWKGDHPDIAESAGNLAQCLFNQGRAIEAVPYFERCLAVFNRVYDPDHHDIATAAFRYAACLASLGRKQEAAEQLRTVVRVRRHVLPPTHPDIEVAEMSLGGVLIQLGEFGEAEPLLLGVEERLRGREDVPWQTRRFSLTVLVKLYERLDVEEPGVGYGAKATSWKERLAAFDTESP